MDTNEVMTLLTEMAVFVMVVEEGSFSKAGQKLHLAPSSISRSISRLEAAFGTKLLERTTRKVTLNPKGAEVFDLCQSMLASAKLAANAAQSIPGEVSGKLRVAAPKAFAKQVLSPIVLDFVQAFPHVTLTLKAHDHFIDPVSGEVDIIIHCTHHPIEGLVAKPLSHTKLKLCASPDYLAKHGAPQHPNDLVQHACITLGEDAGDEIWQFEQGKQHVKVKVASVFAVNHTQIRRDAVLKGVGKYQGDIYAQYAQSKYVPTQIRAFIEFVQSRLNGAK